MLVMKFGGTSVGSSERIKALVKLVVSEQNKIVVLSAMAGTTNSLVEICNSLYNKETEKANQQINSLEEKYFQEIQKLYTTNENRERGKELIKSHFDYLRSFTQDMFTLFEERAVLAQGELISTAMFHFYLKEININSILLPALNFMRIDENDEPDYISIKENLNKELEKYPNQKLFITQGYICRNAFGEIDNLKRGGSDYTASIIGGVLKAKEIQIWTDIDGMHNNDPRIVEGTKPIAKLSFDEAAELAYFGAKILHPQSVFPAQQNHVPVRLKNTMQPEAEGTIISDHSDGTGIKAIAAKDDITAIKIKSGRMLLAYGFLRKVFEVFEIYKTSIDMITTSEVAVSLTIDNNKNIAEITQELEKFGQVEIDENLTIICIVGDLVAESKGLALTIFDALKNIPVRMISYGGSTHNISVLIKTENKKEALNALHKKLF
ncbi:MAG: aspartate kinase [Flavobacteriales bacterium]|nr:aspartate kinase [Flavobacteriales bacterium]